ncbi:MAG: 2-oxoglutarate and iron-dependent oxygenase domain-containing protein [Candidatus Algichlamydia australiensis]|nr:2-oxoglutarate and iron-dependent oxygenase domain-containing protein [Chlamydiales bacterium]
MRKILVIFGLATSIFAFESTIPVLDMNDYYENRELFLEQLSEAFHEIGFFALINTDIEKEILDKGYRASFDLFSLPMAEKLSLYDPQLSGRRGFVPSETASTL